MAVRGQGSLKSAVSQEKDEEVAAIRRPGQEHLGREKSTHNSRPLRETQVENRQVGEGAS